MGSPLHRNDGGRRRTTIVIPATAGIHRGGPAMGSVSTGTTVGGGAHTIVIPATAGIHRGGPAMGSRLHANYGRRRRTTIVIPATAGIHRGGPAMGSRLHANYGRRRRTHNRHSRDGGNPQRGAGNGFPSPPKRRAAAGAPHNRHSRDGGNPQRGAGNGFPSPPKRRAAAAHPREAAAHPTIVIPATAGIHRGGPAMGSRLHRNDGRRRRTHGRRRRTPQSSFPRRRESTQGGRVPLSSSEQVPRRAGPRAASNVRYNDERRHRRSADATAARGRDARWIEAGGGATDVSELR